MKCTLLILLLSLSAQANNINLLFRSDISEGFNIPYGSKLFDSTPVSSPQGDVAIVIPSLQERNQPAIWIKSSHQKKGEIKWTGAEGEKVSELGITENGDVCFAQYDQDFFLKQFVYLRNDGSIIRFTSIPKTWGFASALPKNQKFNCLFSIMNVDGEKHLININFKALQSREVYQPELGVSYLFTPTSNFKGELFFKVRKGNKDELNDQQPDELIKIAKGQKSVLLTDKDTDKSSRLQEFSHLISNNQHQDLCFYANKYQKLIVLNKNKKLTNVPLPEGEPELFTPVITNQQQVLVRHKVNGLNQVSIWQPKKQQWELLLKENQVIAGDIGPLTLKAVQGPAFAGALSAEENFLFIQVRFFNRKNQTAGQGLLQVEL